MNEERTALLVEFRILIPATSELAAEQIDSARELVAAIEATAKTYSALVRMDGVKWA